MRNKHSVYVTAASFVGGRDENQDCYLIDDVYEIDAPGNISLVTGNRLKVKKELCFAVSDGMGGLENGSLTSLNVIRNIHRRRKAIGFDEKIWTKINRNVIRGIQRSGTVSGATASICKLIAEKGRLYAHIFTIGDSPVYYFSGKENTVSLVNTLDNEAGLSQEPMTEEEREKKSHYLCHYFGKQYGDRVPPVHQYAIEVFPGDIILIASDGICSIDENRIRDVVMQPKYTNLALSLTSAAIEAGDNKWDNTTAVAIEIDDVRREDTK